MTTDERIIAEFYEKFSIRNKTSRDGTWWIVPLSHDLEEVASPLKVGAWLRDALRRRTAALIEEVEGMKR